MNRFNNGRLTQCLRELERTSEDVASLHEAVGIEHGDRDPLTYRLRQLITELERVGLRVSLEMARMQVEGIHNLDDYGPQVEALRQAVESEMNQDHFFCVPAERAEWLMLDPTDLLGDEYFQNFRGASLNDDCLRAMRCHAFGEATACAFHLMRLYEAPIRALARALNFREEQHRWTWEAIAKHCETTAQTSGCENFVRGACRKIRTVAHEWRNPTMHCIRVFSPEESRTLLTIIPDLVRHLASGVREDAAFV